MNRAISFSFSDQKNMDAAFAIRQEVFVVEQQVDKSEEYDEFEQSSIHYLVFVDDKPVGTARWRITKDGIKLERFAVLKEYRNAKAGRTVLLKVMEDVIPLGRKIYMNAQITAMKFYEREGFVAEGEMFVEANIQHYRMVLKSK
ncbi:MAG: GNAT family N-acetyltransferase [Bacteroidota bacterium]